MDWDSSVASFLHLHTIFKDSDLAKQTLGWVTFVAGIALGIARFSHGWAFLARYHYDGGALGYVRVFDRFLLTVLVDPAGWRSTDAARLLTEFEILKPLDERPRRHERSPEKMKWWAIGRKYSAWRKWRSNWRVELQEWRIERKNWKAERYRMLNNLIEREKESRGKIIAQSPAERVGKLPVIHLDNTARIDRNRDKIARYFAVGRKFDAYEFVSYVQLTYGYFAPLFLISGLMTRFDSQWEPIINHYRAQIKGQDKTSKELLELQSFELNCWLLWGPSIPLCTCQDWKAAQNPHSIFYQYEFGDENNSVDVRLPDGRTPTRIEEIRQMMIQTNGDDPSLPQTVCAAPQSLLGQIGIKIDKSQLCASQTVIADQEGHGRIFLTFEDFLPPDNPSYYYSAYIWLMFVVCDRQGNPLHPEPKWKNLLPFFEHGNIADATTMKTLKESLVAKACNALKELLGRHEDRERITIRYACAFDDSNCGLPIMFPPPIRAGIFDVLKAAVADDKILEKARHDGRLNLDNERRGNARHHDSRHKGNEFASCKLPEIAKEFYDAVQQASDDEKRNGVPR
jgi:hypothetical protein